MSARRRKAQPLAPVDTSLRDYNCAIHMVADLQARMGRVKVAPIAEQRAYEFQSFWAAAAYTEKRLAAITAPGLRRHVAELRRQFDAVYFAATAAALRESQRECGGDVVSLAEARERRAQAGA